MPSAVGGAARAKPRQIRCPSAAAAAVSEAVTGSGASSAEENAGTAVVGEQAMATLKHSRCPSGGTAAATDNDAEHAAAVVVAVVVVAVAVVVVVVAAAAARCYAADRHAPACSASTGRWCLATRSWPRWPGQRAPPGSSLRPAGAESAMRTA